MSTTRKPEDAGTPARCVMVLGTSSGAGKSWLATALCRHYANQGLRVAPFKAQNMSNNVRVVAGLDLDRQLPVQDGESCGGEIGSAQYFQALAARAEPDVRMNPLLLKPEADTHSQVVLLGRVSSALSALPWRGRSSHVWPQIAAALDALRAENDVVVIEGAGSPAEINLMDSDVVNLRVARHADARCLLVSDIDRGGAFAHLFGTWALLPEDDRQRLHGFVLNKFRGDVALLAPAPELLEQRTGVPTVAVVPMRRDHGLPEEDGVADHGGLPVSGDPETDMPVCRMAVVCCPRSSNLDEFQPLCTLPGVYLGWAHHAAALADVDWIVLPGSQAPMDDLAWLSAQGLDVAITQHAARGGRVLGIGSGLQWLGTTLAEASGGVAAPGIPALALLPLQTVWQKGAAARRVEPRFGELAGAWSLLSGVQISGFAVHGLSISRHGTDMREVMPGLAWQNAAGNVLGLAMHGLFEDARVSQALFGARMPSLDAVFDGLAREIENAFNPGVLDALIAP